MADSEEAWDDGGDTPPIESRNPYDDCFRLLLECGIITTPRPGEDLDGHGTEGPVDLFKRFAENIGIDDDNVIECIASSGLAFMEGVNLNDPEVLFDPCDPQVTPENILKDAFENACSNSASGVISPEDLYNSIAESFEELDGKFDLVVKFDFDASDSDMYDA